MERRVLLAIFLAFLVLYTWQALFVKPAPKPGATAAAPSGAVQPADTAAAGAAPTENAAAAGASATPASSEGTTPPAGEAGATSLVAETAERDVRVETGEVIAVFTNRGARLKSWRLKRYHNQANEPQELVEHGLPAQPLPFTLRTGPGAIDHAAEHRAVHSGRHP